MVPADEGDAVWISHFERQEEEESFDAVKAPIYKVSNENIIGLRASTSNLKELHQIEELAMDVAADGYWCIDNLDITLLDKDLSSFDT